jgi:hypothetical protein
MLGRTTLLLSAGLIGVFTLKKETKDRIRSKVSAGLLKMADAVKPKEEAVPDQNEFIRTLFQLN